MAHKHAYTLDLIVIFGVSPFTSHFGVKSLYMPTQNVHKVHDGQHYTWLVGQKKSQIQPRAIPKEAVFLLSREIGGGIITATTVYWRIEKNPEITGLDASTNIRGACDSDRW